MIKSIRKIFDSMTRSRGAAQRDGDLWLVKHDPKGEWFCDCDEGVVDASYHDKETSPIGGTGWLFVCSSCNRAFMVARAQRIGTTLVELAMQRTPRVQKIMDCHGNRTDRTLLAGPEDWLAKVRPMAAGLVEGQTYVFFDGVVLPARRGPVKFSGLWRDHDLPDLPHFDSSDAPPTTSSSYWWPAGELDEADEATDVTRP